MQRKHMLIIGLVVGCLLGMFVMHLRHHKKMLLFWRQAVTLSRIADQVRPVAPGFLDVCYDWNFLHTPDRFLGSEGTVCIYEGVDMNSPLLIVFDVNMYAKKPYLRVRHLMESGHLMEVCTVGVLNDEVRLAVQNELRWLEQRKLQVV